MGKNKKVDLVALIVFGVLVLSIVMAIVGVCIAWTSTTVKASDILGGAAKTTTTTLSDLAEANSKLVKNGGDPIDGFNAMAAFAYITVILTGLTTVSFVVSKFVKVKALKWVTVALSLLLVVSAIVAIATAYSFCGNYKADALVASSNTVPAAGAWLLTVFGILGGAAGVVGALKK